MPQITGSRLLSTVTVMDLRDRHLIEGVGVVVRVLLPQAEPMSKNPMHCRVCSNSVSTGSELSVLQSGTRNSLLKSAICDPLLAANPEGARGGQMRK